MKAKKKDIKSWPLGPGQLNWGQWGRNKIKQKLFKHCTVYICFCNKQWTLNYKRRPVFYIYVMYKCVQLQYTYYLIEIKKCHSCHNTQACVEKKLNGLKGYIVFAFKTLFIWLWVSLIPIQHVFWGQNSTLFIFIASVN